MDFCYLVNKNGPEGKDMHSDWISTGTGKRILKKIVTGKIEGLLGMNYFIIVFLGVKKLPPKLLL